MGLFSPAWKSRNEEKALACVRATGDQATLERIAREALTSRVRMNAAEKLTEPERINRLAAESPDHYVRSTLAGKVTDQALLQRLAGQDEDFLVRSKSLKKIEDELFLAAYALKINHDELAQIAVRGIRSQALLAALAAGCDREVVIRECLDKLGDQPSPEALEALANGKHRLVRGYLRKQRVRAIRGMKDKGELLRAAREESDAGCRVAALETLRDRKLCGPEDRDALYLFRSQYGGYRVPKEALGERQEAFRRFIQNKTGKLFIRRLTPLNRVRSWLHARESEPTHL